MKKKILLFGTLCAFAASVVITVLTSTSNFLDDAQLLTPAQALAQDESGVMLICRCSMLTTQNCATNNWGAQCAGGQNVMCWNYNLNCN